MRTTVRLVDLDRATRCPLSLRQAVERAQSIRKITKQWSGSRTAIDSLLELLERLLTPAYTQVFDPQIATRFGVLRIDPHSLFELANSIELAAAVEVMPGGGESPHRLFRDRPQQFAHRNRSRPRPRRRAFRQPDGQLPAGLHLVPNLLATHLR